MQCITTAEQKHLDEQAAAEEEERERVAAETHVSLAA